MHHAQPQLMVFFGSSKVVRPRTAITLVLAFALAFLAMDSHAMYEIVGRPFVQDDCTIEINNHVVHLYGIYIPPSAREDRCWNLRRGPCTARAALDFRVQGFVHCYPQGKYDDGSLSAVCYVNQTTFHQGIDLAAYLLKSGYALATDDAPLEYRAYERKAQSLGLGVWGFPVDTINGQPLQGHR
jgi:endonuclease YncB( thermonuclease family)